MSEEEEDAYPDLAISINTGAPFLRYNVQAIEPRVFSPEKDLHVWEGFTWTSGLDNMNGVPSKTLKRTTVITMPSLLMDVHSVYLTHLTRDDARDHRLPPYYPTDSKLAGYVSNQLTITHEAAGVVNSTEERTVEVIRDKTGLRSDDSVELAHRVARAYVTAFSRTFGSRIAQSAADALYDIVFRLTGDSTSANLQIPDENIQFLETLARLSNSSAGDMLSPLMAMLNYVIPEMNGVYSPNPSPYDSHIYFGAFAHEFHIPVMWFLFSVCIVRNVLPGETTRAIMILHDWTRALVGYVHPKTAGIRKIGPFALSFLIEVAAAKVGHHIDFVVLDAAFATQDVIAALGKDIEVPFIDLETSIRSPAWRQNVMPIFEGTAKNRSLWSQEAYFRKFVHMIVVTPELHSYWKNYVQASPPDRKRQRGIHACIVCGNARNPLAPGGDQRNGVFCGEHCHMLHTTNSHAF